MPNSAQISTTERVQATQVLYNNLIKDVHRMLSVSGGTKTISARAITVSPGSGEGHYVVSSAGATDNLDIINGGAAGDIITLVAASGKTITLRTGVGGSNKIVMPADRLLSTTEATSLRFDGTNWSPVGANTFSGAVDVTNHMTSPATSMSEGEVVVLDTSGDLWVNLTTYERDLRVFGVVAAPIAFGEIGPIYNQPGKKVTVKCDTGAVARGQYLITSTLRGHAKGGSYYRETGCFAVALTSKSAGATGTVQAILLDNTNQFIVGTSGWALGGGVTAINTSQKMTFATETWATIAGAALPAARNNACGMGYGTVAGYASMGADSGGSASNSNYKVVYATEVSSTLGVGLQRDFMRSGINFASKGFMAGGFLSGTNRAEIQKTTFSTDAISSIGAVLTVIRQSQGGSSDGTYAYIAGSSVVTADRIDNATETIAAAPAANLAAYANGYTFVSFPASASYRAMNNGSNNYTRKLTFATATDANNASGPTGALDHAQNVTDGIAFGYLSNASRANKLDAATGTYSSSTAVSFTDRGANSSYGAF